MKIISQYAGNKCTMPEDTTDLRKNWHTRDKPKEQQKWWRNKPAIMLWTIWKERNARCLEGAASSMQIIKKQLYILLSFWCKEEMISDTESLDDTLADADLM